MFAQNLDVLDAARCALTGRQEATGGEAVRFALVRTDQWSHVTDDGRAALEEAAARVHAPVRQLPDELLGLTDQQPIVQAYEGARALAWERQSWPELLSPGLRQILDRGDEIRPDEYDAARRGASRGRGADIVDRLFGGAGVVLTPAVLGEAPEGLASTGDPRLCRLWTLLGFPALSVPGLVGATGMPIGIQLVARPHDDGLLIRAGRKLAAALA